MNAAARRTRFRVEGMDCASCAAKIDKAVRRIPDVTDVNVSVVAGTVSVEHGDKLDLDTLAQKVNRPGYKATRLGAVKKSKAAETAHGQGRKSNHADHDHEHVDHDHSGHEEIEALHVVFWDMWLRVGVSNTGVVSEEQVFPAGHKGGVTHN